MFAPSGRGFEFFNRIPKFAGKFVSVLRRGTAAETPGLQQPAEVVCAIFVYPSRTLLAHGIVSFFNRFGMIINSFIVWGSIAIGIDGGRFPAHPFSRSS